MRYLRYYLTLILIIVAGLVIYSKFRGVYYDIPSLLREANKPFLFFLILFQGFNYLGDGWLSQILLSIAGFRVKLKDTLKVAVLGVAGNHVAPFVGGAITTFYAYKKLNIPSAVISFLVFSWSFFVWSNYALFFFLSLILLPSLVFNFLSFRSLFIIILIAILFFTVLFFLFKKRGKYLAGFLNIISNPINKISNFLKISKKIPVRPKLFEKFFSDFHQCLDLLLKNKNKIPQLLVSSLLFYIGDILTFYFAFLVFGFHPNFALLIAGYTISLFLTIITLMPSTPGVMEASLMMVFVKIGFPAHIVVFASLLFRIFSYWLPLPVSIISYLRLKKVVPEENNIKSGSV